MVVMMLLLMNEGKLKAVARARGTLLKSMLYCELSVVLCLDEYI